MSRLNKFGITRYDVKPEQLAAVQERVKMFEAEGRRLDGSKPVQSWQELRLQNHELQKKIEQQEDLIDDYKRRYHAAHEETLALREQADNDARERSRLQLETECLKADIRNAAQIVRGLCEILATQYPAFGAELGINKAEQEEAKPAQVDEKVLRKREYARRYYQAHRAERLAYNAEYQRTHREQRRETQKRYIQRKREAEKNAGK